MDSERQQIQIEQKLKNLEAKTIMKKMDLKLDLSKIQRDEEFFKHNIPETDPEDQF